MSPDPVVLRPSATMRVVLIVGGAAATVYLVGLASTGGPLWLLPALCGVGMVVEGVRGRVEVARARDEVVAVKILQRRQVRISDVAAIHVARQGQVRLVLRPGSDGRPRRGVATSLRSATVGDDALAPRLAALLGAEVQGWQPDAQPTTRSSRT